MKCKGIHNPSGDRDNCGRKQKILEQRNKNQGKSEENVQQCGKEENPKKERTPFKSPLMAVLGGLHQQTSGVFLFLNHGLKTRDNINTHSQSEFMKLLTIIMHM